MSNCWIDLAPIGVGNTNILFLDKAGKLIKNVGIVVNDGLPPQVEIHNKALISS